MESHFYFFCPMFIDELFNSAKPVSMLLSVRNSQNKAQSNKKIYVTLNKAAKQFWRFVCKQTKTAQDQLQYMKSKAALQEIRSRPEL